MVYRNSELANKFMRNRRISNDKEIRNFGFFDDEEETFSFMRSRLIDDIENDKLYTENPSAPETTEKAPETTAKPKLQLKRK